MVKLEPKPEFNLFGVAFYFHNMNDCEAFMYVFKDHWCNVPWKEPVEAPDFPEMSEYDRKHLDDDPKKRADRNLSWGFNLVRDHHIDNTDEQKSFLDGFVNEILQHANSETM